MLLDNPFLVRELRQLERRPRGVQNSLLACLGIMALALLGAIFFQVQTQTQPANRDARQFVVAGLRVLGLSHVLLCGITAAYGGYRLFAVENARSTFESLQILPYSPWRWLWLKLAFPILCTLVAWAAGLPFYILAAFCTLIRIEAIPYLTRNPLLAAATILVLALLTTPEMISKHREMMARQQKGVRRADRDYSIWSSLTFGLAYLVMMYILITPLLPRRELVWFSLWLTEGWFWVAGIACIVPAAVTTAATALVFSERLRTIAWYLRLLAVSVIYVICLGFFWPHMSQWFKLGAILLPPLMWLLTWSKADRPENGRNEAYVQRIAARWDNPLLIHDLRVSGRNIVLSQAFLHTLILVLLCPPLAYYGFVWLGRPAFVQQLLFQTVFGALQTIPGTWSVVSTRWQKEWSSGTMSQLLITPLTEREIILGRLAAVPAFQWVALSPVLGALIAVIGWGIFWKGYWVCGPLALALAPLMFSMGVWMSFGVARPNKYRMELTLRDLPRVALMGGQTLLFYGCFLLGAAGIDPTSDYAPWISGPVIGWLFGILLCLFNIALCLGWIELRVWELRSFRSGDIDVPDSKIMEQAGAGKK